MNTTTNTRTFNNRINRTVAGLAFRWKMSDYHISHKSFEIVKSFLDNNFSTIANVKIDIMEAHGAGLAWVSGERVVAMLHGGEKITILDDAFYGFYSRVGEAWRCDLEKAAAPVVAEAAPVVAEAAPVVAEAAPASAWSDTADLEEAEAAMMAHMGWSEDAFTPAVEAAPVVVAEAAPAPVWAREGAGLVAAPQLSASPAEVAGVAAEVEAARKAPNSPAEVIGAQAGAKPHAEAVEALDRVLMNFARESEEVLVLVALADGIDAPKLRPINLLRDERAALKPVAERALERAGAERLTQAARVLSLADEAIPEVLKSGAVIVTRDKVEQAAIGISSAVHETWGEGAMRRFMRMTWPCGPLAWCLGSERLRGYTAAELEAGLSYAAWWHKVGVQRLEVVISGLAHDEARGIMRIHAALTGPEQVVRVAAYAAHHRQAWFKPSGFASPSDTRHNARKALAWWLDATPSTEQR